MKKIMIANGTYKTREGQDKTNWVKLGMIGVSQNGKEYVLLDPTINLAAFKEQGKDMIMCSVFEDQQRQQTGMNSPVQHTQYRQPINDQDDGLPF